MHANVKTGPSVELRVDYQRLNTFFADYIKRISRGETFIATQRPLALGTEFLFVLGVPKLEQPLVLGGKVAGITSTEEAPSPEAAGMRVELSYESQDEQRFVQDTVRQLMESELGPRLTAQLLV